MQITKLMLCKGIESANDWNTSIKLSDVEVKKMLLWLKAQMPVEFQSCHYTSQIERTTLDNRTMCCFKFALQHLFNENYGHAMHEVHDLIYGFGQNLEVPVSNFEWMMLSHLVERGLDSLKKIPVL